MPRPLTIPLMSLAGLRAAWQRLHLLPKRLVQECPPELTVCETCDRARCTTERWLTCEKRLAAVRGSSAARPVVENAPPAR